MSVPEKLRQAIQLHRTGQSLAAISLFQQVIRTQPNCTEAYHQMGNALKSLGRFPEALTALQSAQKLAPQDAVICLNLGVTKLELRKTEEALQDFQRAVELQPDRPEAHNILGHTALTLGRLGEAEAALLEAIRWRADYAPAYDNLGRLYRIRGMVTESVASFRRALQLQPKLGTHSNLLLALNYDPKVKPDEIWAEHRGWAECLEREFGVGPRSKEKDDRQERRIRVGYVSPDFCLHAVAFFFEAMLDAHDRGGFEVFCYSGVTTPDRVTARLRAKAEHWREVARLSDEQLGRLIEADGVDILVDLSGHTAGHRLAVFARRAARVQVSCIGYPNTTGLTQMDYRITDAVTDPVGKTEPWHSETLVRLAGPFSCYRPPEDSPACVLAGEAEGRVVTFGSFNNYAKVSPQVVAIWARILKETPGARLMLKSRGLEDASMRRGVEACFAREGVAAERLVLDGRELSVSAHLALYGQVDVALDPFPYTGTTTTCEALWMGVPVVTLAGATHVGRVGASLLKHLGRPEWIAESEEDYVALACGLAKAGLRSTAERAALREQMGTGALCDSARYMANVEEAYRRMLAGELG